MPSDVPTIYAILARAQAAWRDPKRTSTGQVGRGKYMYASIENVLALVREHLAPQGVALVQTPTTRHVEDRVELVVDTMLAGPAGDRVEHSMAIPFHAGATPQQVGSAITYARRYSLLAMLGLGQEDDDGAAASTTPKAKPPAPKKEAKPKSKPPLEDGFGRWIKARDGGGFNIATPSGHESGDTVEVKRRDGGIQPVVLVKLMGIAPDNREEWTWTRDTEPETEQ